MYHEEIVSRYGKMEEDRAKAIQESDSMRGKVNDYERMRMHVQMLEKYREELMKEVEFMNNRQETLKGRIAEKDVAIEELKQVHVKALEEQRRTHNIECNELEQKIVQERLKAV